MNLTHDLSPVTCAGKVKVCEVRTLLMSAAKKIAYFNVVLVCLCTCVLSTIGSSFAKEVMSCTIARSKTCASLQF